MRPHIGMEVTPSIRLTRALGSGGMGSVWVGCHSGLRANVAVKFLSAELSTNEGALARFASEARVAAQIKSPHAVQVHDHGVHGGELPYIVMELLEGVDLAREVDARGPLDLSRLGLLVQQLGQVLTRAHGVGIVHRDVKPENVFLLDGYGRLFIKLIDFGIAKQTSREPALTATGMMMGTPDFMCPEQLESAKDVGPAADVWSLATVAYYALSGVRPFNRSTIPATLLAIEKGEFSPPFVALGKGNSALDAFFARAFCRDPLGRFDSLDEFVSAFCQATQVPETRTLPLPVALRPTLESGQHVGPEGTLESGSTGLEPVETVRGTRTLGQGLLLSSRQRLAFAGLLAAGLVVFAWLLQDAALRRAADPPRAAGHAEAVASAPGEEISIDNRTTPALSKPPPTIDFALSGMPLPQATSASVERPNDRARTTSNRRDVAPPPRQIAPPAAARPKLKDRGF